MDKITLINPQIEEYAEKFATISSDLSTKISKDTHSSLQYAQMLSGNQVTGLISMIIKLSKAVHAAEIGMFTGLSTLAIIEALPDNGKLFSLEMNERYIDLALSNLKDSKSYEKLHLMRGDARTIVHLLPNNLDFVFLDADKEYYPHYYEVLLKKMRVGGIIVADNVNWYGGVLSEKKDRKSKAIHDFNNLVQTDKRVENVMLTVRDGLMLIRKIAD
jgi:caffeoyl-CoA O-methyltransferase